MKTSQTLGDSEFNRYGIIALNILILGCLGGLAMGLGAVKDISTLILVVVPTMLNLSFLLAVAPMRWIFITGGLAIILDLTFIMYFLLS